MYPNEMAVGVRELLPILLESFQIVELGHIILCVEEFELEFRIPCGAGGLW